MQNGKASYLLWMQGMHSESLTGTRPGMTDGTNLTFIHFFAVGANLGKGFSLKLTQPVTQNIDEKDETVKKQWQPGNPYLTLSHGKILSSERYAANLEGYFRYYIPVSRGTQDAMNKGFLTSGFAPVDNGRGAIRLFLNPSKSFLDGKLTFNGAMLTNIHLNALSKQERINRQAAELGKPGASGTLTGEREKLNVVINPSVVYSVNPKVDVYLEWATGTLRNDTAGRWTSINVDDDGQYLSPGVYWSPTKKVYVNPYISYQLSNADTDKRLDLTHFDIGVQLQYTFL
jgi:hypothetical protein